MEHDYQSYFTLSLIMLSAFCFITIIALPQAMEECHKCENICAQQAFNASNHWDARNIPDKAPENINWTSLYKEI